MNDSLLDLIFRRRSYVCISVSPQALLDAHWSLLGKENVSTSVTVYFLYQLIKLKHAFVPRAVTPKDA